MPSFAKRVVGPVNPHSLVKEGLISTKSTKLYAKTDLKKGDLIHREEPLALIDQALFLPQDSVLLLGKTNVMSNTSFY